MLNNITTGNFDDDFEKISKCDWIIEVVVERLDIKISFLKKWISIVKLDPSFLAIHPEFN